MITETANPLFELLKINPEIISAGFCVPAFRTHMSFFYSLLVKISFVIICLLTANLDAKAVVT